MWVLRALDVFGIHCSLDVLDLPTKELPLIAKLFPIYKREKTRQAAEDGAKEVDGL